MALKKYQVENNAESTLLASISASATSLIIATSEGDLYPSTFPFKLTLEKFNSDTVPKVIKREVIECTNRIGDSFTIVRASEACVQDETSSPKTSTNNGLSFDSGDKVSIYDTKDQRDDLQNEVVRLEADKLDIQDYIEGKKVFNASSVGSDAYQITVTDLISYVNGAIYRVQADVANTGIATLEINALGAKSLKKTQGTEDLIDNDIKANGIFSVVYNSTLDVFQYSSQLANPVSAETDINGLTEKVAPVDADEVIIYDSVGLDNKKAQLINLKDVVSKKFGTRFSMSNNVTYNSTTDGIVTGYGSGAGDKYIQGYVDGVVIVANAVDAAAQNERIGVCFPVISGETYKVFADSGFVRADFTPLS